MQKITLRLLMPALVLLTAIGVSTACAADWPQFRGPSRDNISPDTGLLQEWPKEGPKLIWSSDKVGFGWASVAIVGERIYTMGLIDRDNEGVVALDLDGNLKWQKKLEPASGGGGFKGTRSTPTVDGDRLYVLTSEGGLYCLATADGEIRWKKNILRQYKAPQIRHSLAESVLIDGDRAIVSPGGTTAMVALNKMTGEEIWKAPKIEENASYTSAILVDFGGLRQIVNVSGNFIFGVEAASGKLLWKHEHKTPWEVNCNSPLYHDGVIYVVRGYKLGGVALRLMVDAAKHEARVEEIWKSKVPDDFLGGTLLKDGRLYGTGHEIPGFYCIDWKTGNKVYENKKLTEASITWADGRLYVQEHAGMVNLVDPGDGSVKGQLKQENRRRELWAYPVVLNGRMYIRNQSRLSVYDVRAEKPAEKPAEKKE